MHLPSFILAALGSLGGDPLLQQEVDEVEAPASLVPS